MRQGKANDQGEQMNQSRVTTGYRSSLVEGRESKSSGMSNEVRRGRRTSGDNMAQGPAQHRKANLVEAMLQNQRKKMQTTTKLRNGGN